MTHYLFATVMSSVNSRNLDQVLAEVFVVEDGKVPPGRLIRHLLNVAATLGDDRVMIRVLGIISTPSGEEYDAWQLSALGEVVDVLDRRRFSLENPPSSAGPELRSALDNVARVFQLARQIAGDGEAEPTRRRLAAKLLGHGPVAREDDIVALGRLLVPQSSLDLQIAAGESLGKLNDDRVSQILVARWKQHGPQLRRNILDLLISR